MNYDKIANQRVDRFTKVAAKVDPESNRELEGVGAYNKEKVQHIADLLYNISSALGYVHFAQKELNELNGHQISPDGKLGGKGYVITIKKFKDTLATIGNSLSDLDDSLSDELNNPRWNLEDAERNEILSKRNQLKDSSAVKAEDNADSVDGSGEVAPIPEFPDDGSEETPMEEDPVGDGLAPTDDGLEPTGEAGTEEPQGDDIPYAIVNDKPIDTDKLPYDPVDDVSDEELTSLRKKFASAFGNEPDPLKRPLIHNMINKGARNG